MHAARRIGGLVRYLPYGAAFAISAVLIVCYFAFPREVEIEKRLKVDPYAALKVSSVVTEQINGEFVSRCEFRENRAGITQGTSPPQEGDLIVVVCEARKPGPAG